MATGSVICDVLLGICMLCDIAVFVGWAICSVKRRKRIALLYRRCDSLWCNKALANKSNAYEDIANYTETALNSVLIELDFLESIDGLWYLWLKLRRVNISDFARMASTASNKKRDKNNE